MFNTVKINDHGSHDTNRNDNHSWFQFHSPKGAFDQVLLGHKDC